MKKILIVAAVFLMTQLSVSANMMQNMRHANPLPNLVSLSLNNASTLKLSEAQIKDLKTWSRDNKPNMIKLIQLVISEEKALMMEALTTDKDVIKKAETMLDARREIIKIKTLCRENLRKILTKDQYAQVIAMFIENRKGNKGQKGMKGMQKGMR
ncbi:hypothetical protein GJV85_05715 [Sulfurimonas aquatica]|uniref:Periplasmic heavy metal sensor n=1 Tax=Sulfurimonas aquatica TaxID=2672570 RepID=A0A975AZV9_9BACT|nr:hypothetical protein [Sulfurimonas aquatica]QSZ41622.1 hypothetical protein GJV85_05715 [Sulfurimonas aquatica]